MSSESRIWEIRPFGSMRGGSELVIGLGPFNPSASAYSTKRSRERKQYGTFVGAKKAPTGGPFNCGSPPQFSDRFLRFLRLLLFQLHGFGQACDAGHGFVRRRPVTQCETKCG